MEFRVLAEPVLVGRERELELLQRYLNLAIDGKGTTVFISAEAGIGKTRLVNEFLKLAKQEETTVTLFGWCLFNAGVPYFPFIEAFNSYYSAFAEKTGKEKLKLNSLLKRPAEADLSGKPDYFSAQALKDQTFVSVAEIMRSISARNPVILFIEDIQWADSASLALIHYIARSINNSKRVLILATFRSEELTSNSEGYPHQLIETLCMMRREDLFSEIKLANLDETCIVTMAESMLGGRLRQDLAQKLAVESEGNPLFIVESLRMLHEHQSLAQEDNEWHLTADQLGIPLKIKDIIIKRLACLNSAQRKILDAASVIGEEFDVGLLSAVIDQDSLEVMEKLNVITHSTLLVHVDENQYRFDHSKSRETLYESIASPLRRGYHERIAKMLESAKNAVLPLSDLAYHYAQAGNKEKAVEYTLAAAKDELAKWSNKQAIEHFQYVLQNIPDNNSELTDEKLDAIEGLGDAYYAASMYEESMRTFEDLLDAAEAGNVKIRALRKAMVSAFEVGDVSHLMELVKRAESYNSADRLESARVLFARGRALTLQGLMPTALEDEKAALKIFEEEYSAWDVAFALIGIGVTYTFLGMPQQAFATSLRSIALFEEMGDFRWQMEAYWTAGIAFGMNLLEDEALKMFGKVLEIEARMKLGDITRVVNAHMYLARYLEPNFQEALPHSLKALELLKKTDSLWATGFLYSNLNVQYALLEDIEHEEEYFEKLMKLPPEVIWPWVSLDRAKAVFYACNGEWNESDRYFKKSFEWLKNVWKNSPGDEVRTKSIYAWALERQGRIEEAKVQRDECQRIRRDVEARFKHVVIEANLMAPPKVTVGQIFEARLDILNVSGSLGVLVGVDSVLNSKLDVAVLTRGCTLQNDRIDTGKAALNPFQVKTIKLNLQAKQPGEVKLSPKVIYNDDFGKTEVSTVREVCITVQAPEFIAEEKRVAEIPKIEVKFSSRDAQRAFDFLVRAFLEDYERRRLPLEKSGWRTLMQLVKNGKVPKYAVYGFEGYGRHVLSELERGGLVEARIFSGERGRGGKIKKVRVLYYCEALKGRLITKK